MKGSMNIPGWRYLVIVGFVLGITSAVRAQRVAVLTTDTLTSTQRSISGAKTVIKSANAGVQFFEFLIPPGNGINAKLSDSIAAVHADIVLSSGSDATAFAKQHFPDAPTVFCSVMYPVISGFVESFARPGRNMTGASLSIPPKTQFEYFKMILPKAKSIGVLYTDNTASLIPPAKVVARSQGLELVALKVTSEREIPAKLDTLMAQVDGLWSLADPVLFGPQTTKYILINALKRGTPLMGFSRFLVESGALFALDFDYKAVGRQAGEMVNEIIRGARPENISVTTPDVIWFHYNEKTAQHMNIKMPEQLVAVAKEVYR
jgi:putative tryptophan/tyrosine transport system substrate-binding protein